MGNVLITTAEMLGSKTAEDLIKIWLLSLVKVSNLSQEVFQVFTKRHPDVFMAMSAKTNALENGAGKYVTHLVSDSASAAQKARVELQRTHHILSIPCVTHIMSLLPKHLVAAGGVMYVKTNIERFEEITKVFRSFAIPKALLEEKGIGLRRLISTRFMFTYSALLRFSDSGANAAIASLIDSEKFLAWEESLSDNERPLIASVRASVNLPEFRIFVSLFLQLVQPWVIAMREFDRAKNSIYIVQPLFCKLASLVVATLTKPTFKDVPAYAKINIVQVVLNFVKKFSNPVFIAAWALCPAYFAEISELPYYEDASRERLRYEAILDALQKVFIVLALRSPIEKGPAANGLKAFEPHEQRSLCDAIALAKEGVDEFRKEYLRKDLRWNADHTCHQEDLQMVDPVVFWAVDAPSSSLLRLFAVVILSIIPSTSTVERGHKDNRNTLTASRNSLGKQKLDLILRSSAIMSSKRYASCGLKRDQNGNLVSQKLSPTALLNKLTLPSMTMEDICREDELENLWDTPAGMTIM